MPTNGYILSVMEQFNAILKAKVLHLLNYKKLSYRHPNKSVLPLHKPWSLTSTFSKTYSRHTAGKVSMYNFDSVFKKQEKPFFKSHTFANANFSQIISRNNLTITQPSFLKLDARFLKRFNKKNRAGLNSVKPVAVFQPLA